MLTQREKLVAAYKDTGRFVMTTQPYHSSRSLLYRVVDFDDDHDAAFAVARQGENRLTYFDYSVGDTFSSNPTIAIGRRATEADTNLGKDKSTNGAQDFVMEGLGFGLRGYRVGVSSGDAAQLPGAGPGPADATVLLATAGQRPIIDPGSIVGAAQCQSPFNLEAPMFQGLLPYMSVALDFDRHRTERLGVLDLFPQAGAASYLRANGVPDSRNRYDIPEGFLWRRDGEPDSEFSVVTALEEDVVCPLNLATDLTDGTTAVGLDLILVDVAMRLYGVGFKLPSEN